jgi:hypothetical protein
MTLPPMATSDRRRHRRQAGVRDMVRVSDARMSGTSYGTCSPGRQRHSDITLYISLVIIHTKYTGWHQNDFNVHA